MVPALERGLLKVLMDLGDAQSFWSKLAMSETKSSAAATVPTTKAPKETITLPVGHDISLSDEHLLSGLLEDLLDTPEMPRRISKSLSSRVPSLGLSSNPMIPFEPNATPGVPWDSSADFGMDFDLDGDGGPSDMGVGDFKHSLGGLGEMVVPSAVGVRGEDPGRRPRRAKRPRTSKEAVIDAETVLGREELLLEGDEGLLPKSTKWDFDLRQWLLHNQLSSLDPKKHPIKPKDIEQMRGIESGLIDEYDPYYHQVEPDAAVAAAGNRVTSSSIGGGGSPLPLQLRSLPGLSATSLAGSSPVPRLGDWDVPSQVALRRDSLDFFCNLQLLMRGKDTVDFDVLFSGKRRRSEAAKNFYHLLNLATSGAVGVRQTAPYEKIAVQLLMEAA